MFNNKVIIIGAIPIYGVDSSYGGTTVLMQTLIDFCITESIPHKLIQSNKFRGAFSPIFNALYVLYQLIKEHNKYSIILLNTSSRGLVFLQPIVYLFARVYKIKIAFRMFGGDFEQVYNRSNQFIRAIIERTVLRSDALFFETKETIKFIKSLKTNTYNLYWLPNVRKGTNIQKYSPDYNKKFVFIGHLKKSKGVEEIITASKKLARDYSIDLYGPVIETELLHLLQANSIVQYKGVLNPNDVMFTLRNYDVLLLPTYFSGEGYPGIIIESFMLGIPVITTFWKSIPEIVNNNEEGKLISPKDTSSLIKAIEYFNKDNYSYHSIKAAEKFADFEVSKVYSNMFDQLSSTINNNK